MLSKSYLIFLSIIVLTFEQQCIIGTNCPFNQGVCSANDCNCLKGYQTLFDKSIPIDQQVFCNYKQISVYAPLIFEIFLPSVGHFMVGKYWFGLIKLTFIIIFISTCLYLYQKLRVPYLLITIFKYIDILSYLGVGEKDDNRDDDGNNEEGEEGGEKGKLRDMKEKKKKKDNTNIIKIYDMSGFVFSILYIIDIFFYVFGIYKDGNGVSFV